ncbi:hypothetical protein VM1G_08760 [Cytospora mali]|uniref:Uncharacterized protein n=1 Tax=Cytospora mali TaxID=578113 RepID=A0A194WAN3_CYTMA|nr:hypothetical protein VM1G_08760 [Valsa mali]
MSSSDADVSDVDSPDVGSPDVGSPDVGSSDVGSSDMGSFTIPPNPFMCSPIRPGESYSAFAQRFRTHRDAARRRIVDEYYREREARLPSPELYPGEAQDDAEMVRRIEEDIYWESRPPQEFFASLYEYPVARAHRLGIPYMVDDGPPWSLTDAENQPYIRPEDREWLDAMDELPSNQGRPVPGASQTAPLSRRDGRDGPEEDGNDQGRTIRSQTVSQKRKRELEEGGGLDGPAKRTRANTHAEATETAATSRQKRKRGQGDDREGQGPAKRARADSNAAIPEAAGPSKATATSRHKRKRGDDREVQGPAKRARADTNLVTSEAAATPKHKRKRGQPVEGDHSTQARSTRSQSGTRKRRTNTTSTITIPPPEVSEPGSKREVVPDEPLQTPQERVKRKRRAGKAARQLQELQAPLGSSLATTTNGAGERKRNSSSAAAGKKSPPPPAQTVRITRAQRQLLSGEDAQLYQLGQRGELNIQGLHGREKSKDTTANKRRSARAEIGTRAAQDRT